MKRWIAVAAGIAVLVVVFLVVKPGGDDGDGSSGPVEVTVAGGKVDGPGELDVKKGDQVSITVNSDVADEVHVHGYDLQFEVAPGQPAKVEFTADAEGVFEIELENAGLLLLELKVTP
jgi:heme/copper-type cytochrome/quinol oxidase subunit 2